MFSQRYVMSYLPKEWCLKKEQQVYRVLYITNFVNNVSYLLKWFQFFEYIIYYALYDSILLSACLTIIKVMVFILNTYLLLYFINSHKVRFYVVNKLYELAYKLVISIKTDRQAFLLRSSHSQTCKLTKTFIASNCKRRYYILLSITQVS